MKLWIQISTFLKSKQRLDPPIGTVGIVIGLVIGVHISEDAFTDGIFDVRGTQLVLRFGCYVYGNIKEMFEMVIPGDSGIVA